mgnify:CR=1 FL=1
MPYVLSPIIKETLEPMWGEGQIYEKINIFKINEKMLPPVNYDQHNFKPHSMTHIETPAHTEINGRNLGYYLKNHQSFFFGPTTVLKLDGDNFKEIGNNLFHWQISKDELSNKISNYKNKIHGKILIAPSIYQIDKFGFHSNNYAFSLSEDAANMIIEVENFHLLGTSWKSLDYNPGRPERPIHKTIFKKALTMENLDLLNVPEGNYFMCNYPIPVEKSSEALVAPILFTKDEIFNTSI